MVWILLESHWFSHIYYSDLWFHGFSCFFELHVNQTIIMFLFLMSSFFHSALWLWDSTLFLITVVFCFCFCFQLLGAISLVWLVYAIYPFYCWRTLCVSPILCSEEYKTAVSTLLHGWGQKYSFLFGWYPQIKFLDCRERHMSVLVDIVQQFSEVVAPVCLPANSVWSSLSHLCQDLPLQTSLNEAT